MLCRHVFPTVQNNIYYCISFRASSKYSLPCYPCDSTVASIELIHYREVLPQTAGWYFCNYGDKEISLLVQIAYSATAQKRWVWFMMDGCVYFGLVGLSYEIKFSFLLDKSWLSRTASLLINSVFLWGQKYIAANGRKMDERTEKDECGL